MKYTLHNKQSHLSRFKPVRRSSHIIRLRLICRVCHQQVRPYRRARRRK